MTTTTTRHGFTIPQETDPNDYPLHMTQLGNSIDAGTVIISMTTTARNALAGAQLWAGRVIYNTTTGRHEAYLLSTWVPINLDSYLRAYTETVVTNAGASGATALDLSTGSVFDVTMAGNVTLSFTNPVASGRVTSFTLILRQDATGSRTITWPSAVKWPSASAPAISTAAGKVDIFAFFTRDGGTTWYPALVGQDFR